MTKFNDPDIFKYTSKLFDCGLNIDYQFELKEPHIRVKSHNFKLYISMQKLDVYVFKCYLIVICFINKIHWTAVYF